MAGEFPGPGSTLLTAGISCECRGVGESGRVCLWGSVLRHDLQFRADPVAPQALGPIKSRVSPLKNHVEFTVCKGEEGNASARRGLKWPDIAVKRTSGQAVPDRLGD